MEAVIPKPPLIRLASDAHQSALTTLHSLMPVAIIRPQLYASRRRRILSCVVEQQ